MRRNFYATFALAAAALLVAALAAHAAAQSTDPKSPTPLTAGEISGGEIEERASYYFTFDAGPGEVTAALEAKIKQGAKGAGVGVELLDAGAKSIASALVSGGLDAGREKIENELFKQLGKLTSAADSLGGGGDTKRKTARARVKTRQPLVLRLTVDKGVESFTLRVGGAVEFAQYAPPADPAQAWTTGETTQTESSDPSSQADPTQVSPQPEPSAPDANAEQVQPTSGKPAVVLPGKRPVLLKIPAKHAEPQAGAAPPPGAKPPLVKVPVRQALPQKSQPQQQPAQKPSAIRIPSKKQP